LALDRLQTEYVDIFHYAAPDDYRHHVRHGGPRLAETLASMQELVDEGKARALALAGLRPEHLGELEEIARAGMGASDRRPVEPVRHPESHRRHRAVQPVAMAGARAAPVRRPARDRLPALDPVAGGLLAGGHEPSDYSFDRARAAEAFDRIEKLERFASDRGRSLPELAVTALVSMGFPSVVAAAASPDDVRAFVAAGESQLTQEELGELARIR
jgi:aryl-alcohol dehydrogenase-like predicted oxidoreductase